MSTTVFAAALGFTLAARYRRERTLSVQHRHAATGGFYQLAIPFTFGLGTAVGDLVDEKLGLGYWPTALIVAVIIGAVALSYVGFGADAS